MAVLSPEQSLVDGVLVRRDSEAAREELQTRVEWRRRNRMRLAGLLTPGCLTFAPDANLDLLSDLGVGIATAEIERRRDAKS